MKKVSTLFMALALALGITAAPAFQPVQKGARKAELEKIISGAKLDVKKTTVAPTQTAHKMMQAPVAKKAAPAAKKAAQAFEIPTYAEVYSYHGFHHQYGDAYVGAWEIDFYDADGYGIASAEFYTEDSLHINGTFNVVFPKVAFADGDTASVSATLTITGLRWNGDSPVYSISVDGVDDQNRAWSFSKEFDVFAVDYFLFRSYYNYYQSGYITIKQLYSVSQISLEDIVIEETGEVVDLAFETFNKAVGQGYVDFTAKNDSFFVYLSFLTESLEDGLYASPDQMDLEYCYLVDLRDTTEIYMSEISALVEILNDTVFVDVDEALGKNGVRYNIDLKYYIPQAVDTVVIMTPDGYATLNDMTADHKQFLVQGLGLDYFVKAQQNINDVYEWSVAVKGADSIIGEFPKNMMFGVQNTYVKHYLNQGADSVVLGAIDAKLTIERVGANLDSAAITLDFLATDTVRYIIYAAVSIAPVDPYEKDEETAVSETFPSDNVTITDYFEKYGDMMLSAYSTDSSKMVLLDFYTSAAALQPGTYTIDNTASAGHAVASTGLQDGYYMYCFYATRDLSTGYIDKVWYLVSGTITVTATDVTVDALNSKGAEVHITIALPEATGIEDVLEDSKLDGKAHKLIEDGQLLIIRDGKAFNAAGQVVK